MTTIGFYSVKGGSGTSTIAGAYALAHDRRLLSHAPDEMDAMIGRARPVFTIDEAIIDGDVLDLGVTTILRRGPTDTEIDHLVLVLRGPCYLALRKAVEGAVRPDGVVLIQEAGRALHRSDVEAAVGVPVIATVDVDPAIARSIDGGLLGMRMPRTLRANMHTIRTALTHDTLTKERTP